MAESPSAYTVSTITCNARLGPKTLRIDLSHLFEKINITEENFLWVEYLNKSRGVYPKKRKVVQPSSKKKKSFDNQVTVIMMMPGYFPNIKIFGNAAVHMTGIRKPEDGLKVLDMLGEEIKKLGTEVAQPSDQVSPCDFVIRMINSGFSVPFKIRRKNLHQLLIGPKYNNICSFQPLTYPGVKLEFYWNSEQKKNGMCCCKGICYGKGSGNGDGNCKKVTVAIFDSGQLLITGANAFCQIDAAYEFICGVIKDNKDEVKKVIPQI